MHAGRAVVSTYNADYVAHDKGNRALDIRTLGTKHPYGGTRAHTIPYPAFESTADAAIASATHIDVSLPAGEASCALVVPEEIFLAEVDARRNSLPDYVPGSAPCP